MSNYKSKYTMCHVEVQRPITSFQHPNSIPSGTYTNIYIGRHNRILLSSLLNENCTLIA